MSTAEPDASSERSLNRNSSVALKEGETKTIGQFNLSLTRLDGSRRLILKADGAQEQLDFGTFLLSDRVELFEPSSESITVFAVSEPEYSSGVKHFLAALRVDFASGEFIVRQPIVMGPFSFGSEGTYHAAMGPGSSFVVAAMSSGDVIATKCSGETQIVMPRRLPRLRPSLMALDLELARGCINEVYKVGEGWATVSALKMTEYQILIELDATDFDFRMSSEETMRLSEQAELIVSKN